MCASYSGEAIFNHQGQWLRGCAPVFSLTIRNPEDMGALAQRVQQALSDNDACMAVGVLNYHAGEHFMGVTTATPSVKPLAVIHGYRSDTLTPWQTAQQRVAGAFTLTSAFASDMPLTEYLQRVARIRRYLAAGDCYQVNFARRFSATWHGNPLAAWQRLLQQHTAPHGCFISTGPGEGVFGVSPERFLAINGRHVVTEPIKGSRPRGDTQAQDRAIGRALSASNKDRAENLMIVDLMRNDLGRLCTTGSIKTDALFELRRFSNVQHLVSTVSGQLRSDISPLSALLQCFPGGSITGAPKKRAMEIIAELETAPRDFYCGSQFSLDREGNLDSSILIRTFQYSGDRMYCHGGGGIVMDSVAESEYRESAFKVEKLMHALAGEESAHESGENAHPVPPAGTH